MSRHSDDGPPGAGPGQPTPGQPTPGHAPPGPAVPGQPAADPLADQTAPGWAVPDLSAPGPYGPGPGPGPGPGEAPADQGAAGWIVPGRSRPDWAVPDPTGAGAGIGTPPPGYAPPPPAPLDPGAAEHQGPADTSPSRLRGFRRRALPAPDPQRQVPALEAGTALPSPDPSESRTIVPGQTAAPGRLGATAGPRGGPGPGDGGGQGQQVPSPGRPALIPRAQSGQDPPPGYGAEPPGPPGTPGRMGRTDFPLPPELPTPPTPPARPAAGEPGSTDLPGRSIRVPAAGSPGSSGAGSSGGLPAAGQRTASGAPLPGQMAGQPRRLTPEQIRTSTFTRSPLGRRGFSEDEVNAFTHRLAEELAARDAEVVRLIDENHRLKQAMRDWQSERIDQPPVDLTERVNAETAVLMARAQQHIDAQLAQTELYCRQREQEAVRRYDEVVRHARQQVRQEAEQVAHRYRATSGAGYNPDQEQLQRQQVYIGALLQALDALGAHVTATRQAFATEIGKLSDPLPGPDPADDPANPLTRRVD